VADLPDFLRAHDQNATTFAVRPGMTLAEVEKLLIRQTLTHVTCNREEAAKLLGISRRSLQYKLKQYGLLEEKELKGADQQPAVRPKRLGGLHK
jgi:DNA-binding NtrC family response regulator